MHEFEKELSALINKNSIEQESDTPDFILANFMRDSLNAFSLATRERDHWYKEKPDQVMLSQMDAGYILLILHRSMVVLEDKRSDYNDQDFIYKIKNAFNLLNSKIISATETKNASN